MTLNFLIVLWIENTSFWSFIINLRLFYYDLLVASSFYYSLLWFWCECEPRSHGWGVLSCCSCLLFYRLTHGSFAGPHLRVAPTALRIIWSNTSLYLPAASRLSRSHVSHCTALAPVHSIVHHPPSSTGILTIGRGRDVSALCDLEILKILVITYGDNITGRLGMFDTRADVLICGRGSIW